MLVLKRRPGEWIEVTHSATGQKCMIGYKRMNDTGEVELLFDDPARIFEFVRPGWSRKAKEGEAK